jgi:hypothetical protein
MEFRKVDDMAADQLETGDFIEIANEVVKVMSVVPQKIGYSVIFENEYGEMDFAHLLDFETVPFYVQD